MEILEIYHAMFRELLFVTKNASEEHCTSNSDLSRLILELSGNALKTLRPQDEQKKILQVLPGRNFVSKKVQQFFSSFSKKPFSASLVKNIN